MLQRVDRTVEAAEEEEGGGGGGEATNEEEEQEEGTRIHRRCTVGAPWKAVPRFHGSTRSWYRA